MKKLAVSLSISLLAAYFQTTVLSRLSWNLFGVTPDLSMIVMIFFAISFGQMRGQLTGYGVGFLEDLLSSSILGFHAAVKMILGAIFGSLKDKIFLESVPSAMFIVAIATLIKYLIASLLSALFSIDNAMTSIFSLTFLFELLVNSVLAIPLFILVRFLIKKLSHFWQWERSE